MLNKAISEGYYPPAKGAEDVEGPGVLCCDIADFYLNSPLPPDEREYIRVMWNQLPEEIIKDYDLAQYKEQGYVYIEVLVGLYGLVYAGLLAFNQLSDLVAQHDYHSTHTSPCIFRSTRSEENTTFAVCVDNFLVHMMRVTMAARASNVRALSSSGARWSFISISYRPQGKSDLYNASCADDADSVLPPPLR